MIPFTFSRGMFVVPLKFMCSTQCETPVVPGASSFDPTRYQHQTDASGAVCTSCTRTRRPFSRTSSWTGIPTIIGTIETYARVEGHGKPAAHRFSYESESSNGRAGRHRALGGDGSLRPDP